MSKPEQPAIAMSGVHLVEHGATILRAINWTVFPSERWVIIGPNGSGKTSLLRLAAVQRGPSKGALTVLGEAYGATDARVLRQRIGFVSSDLLHRLRPTLSARDVVMTGRHAALEPWWYRYDARDLGRAEELLTFVGCAELAGRPIGQLSEGERKRVLIARALMGEPALLLLDEPCAGLDLGAREALIAVTAELAADPTGPPIVLVTHRLEEIPRGFTHALLLRSGQVLALGQIASTLTSTLVSMTFGIEADIILDHGRWSARV